MLEPTPLVASYSKSYADGLGLFLHSNITPRCEPLVSETPFCCWRLEPSSEEPAGFDGLSSVARSSSRGNGTQVAAATELCANCCAPVEGGVPCRVSGCKDVFCGSACEEACFQNLSFAKCRPGVLEGFESLARFRGRNFDGRSVYRLYCQIFGRYFAELVRSGDERSALLRAVRPLALLRPQRAMQQSYPKSLPTDTLLQQITQYLPNPQLLFKTLYPELETSFRFPGLSGLLRRDFCGFLCDLCAGCTFSLGRGAYGIFQVASLLNHSCAPNCSLRFEGGILHLFLEREIGAADELLVNYVGDMPFKERRQRLMEWHGFQCQCWKCLHQE